MRAGLTERSGISLRGKRTPGVETISVLPFVTYCQRITHLQIFVKVGVDVL
jgi:hypothetical protein